MNKSDEEQKSIKWSKKNILAVASALLFAIGIVTYSMTSSLQKLNDKRARFNAMNLDQVAHHILKENEGTVYIDLITSVRNITWEHPTLHFPYYVKEGYLYQLTSGITSKEKIIYKLQESTLKEDCSKAAFAAFLQKGGTMHYTYYLEKEGESRYLFEFTNSWEQCTEDKKPFF